MRPPRGFVATWDFPGEPTSLLTIRIIPATDSTTPAQVAGAGAAEGGPVGGAAAGERTASTPEAGGPVAGGPVAGARAAAVLVLDHVRLPVDQGAGYGAGWHAYLDALASDLGGRQPLDWDARFAALVGTYRARTPARGPGG